jgi:hypothetical protein
MKNFKKLDRIFEHHGDDKEEWPDELMNMPIKDFLDRVKEIDTPSDVEYEILELIMTTLKDKIMKGGYEREEDSPREEMEDRKDMFGSYSEEEGGSMPSYSEYEGSTGQDQSLDEFQF